MMVPTPARCMNHEEYYDLKKLGSGLGVLALAVGIGVLLQMAFAPAAQADERQGYAILRTADGVEVGTATFVESTHGQVRVTVTARNLPAGDHGMHIHAVGRCDGPLFTSAGSHFNPHGQQHGLQTSAGPHAGDLPNLVVNATGSGSIDMTVARFTVHEGLTSVFDADGSALVIHASRDDGITDPTGNSGDRIACGVLSSGSRPAPAQTAPITPPKTGDSGLAR